MKDDELIPDQMDEVEMVAHKIGSRDTDSIQEMTIVQNMIKESTDPMMIRVLTKMLQRMIQDELGVLKKDLEN